MISSNQLFKQAIVSTVLSVSFLWYPQAYAATPEAIAKVVWVKGDVKAQDLQKHSRALQRGADLHEGDTLITAVNSAGQIVFSDQSVVVLSPNTTLQIKNYKLDRQNKSEEKVALNLVKGGMRTITGVIPKDNPESYQVKTPVATIGVRGTDYMICYRCNQKPAKQNFETKVKTDLDTTVKIAKTATEGFVQNGNSQTKVQTSVSSSVANASTSAATVTVNSGTVSLIKNGSQTSIGAGETASVSTTGLGSVTVTETTSANINTTVSNLNSTAVTGAMQSSAQGVAETGTLNGGVNAVTTQQATNAGTTTTTPAGTIGGAGAGAAAGGPVIIGAIAAAGLAAGAVSAAGEEGNDPTTDTTKVVKSVCIK